MKYFGWNGMFAIVLQSRGGFMCVTDTSDKHVLSVWDWEKERMIAKTTVSIHYRSVGTTR